MSLEGWIEKVFFSSVTPVVLPSVTHCRLWKGVALPAVQSSSDPPPNPIKNRSCPPLLLLSVTFVVNPDEMETG